MIEVCSEAGECSSTTSRPSFLLRKRPRKWPIVAVQVWIGEKPEHPNERKAIIALANGLDRLEGLYVMLANFSVGGNTIDLVVIKHDAIFIIEMKHCDGRVYGSVNGRWRVVSASGSVKWLNQGRKNPYNQVIAYYYAFRNFLHDHRLEVMSEQKASMTDFRACKRLIIIAPTLEDGSDIVLDWRVTVKGIDELPTYLVTERSDEINLTESEMGKIPRLLNCTPWDEVNNLVAGVMPTWNETPSEPPPLPLPIERVPEPEPEPTPPPPPLSLRQRIARSSRRTRINVLGWAIVVVMFGLIFFQRQNIIFVTNPIINPTPEIADGSLLPAVAASPTPNGCVTTFAQTVWKERDPVSNMWRTIASRPQDQPHVAVTLDRVEFCPTQMILYWRVQNNTAGIVQMGLNNTNIVVSDTSGVEYRLREERQVIRVRQNKMGMGNITIERAVNPNATTLTIQVQNEPFSKQLWTVQVPRE